MVISGRKWGIPMLRGEFHHNIDEKNRLVIPSKFRSERGDKFIGTRGLDKCLFVYSIEEWKNFEAKLRSLPISNKDARAFSRFFFAGAIDCEIDKQGRFLISGNLREFAGLTKEVVIIGMDSRIEIWSKDKWQQCDDEISADEIAEKMELLGI